MSKVEQFTAAYNAVAEDLEASDPEFATTVRAFVEHAGHMETALACFMEAVADSGGVEKNLITGLWCPVADPEWPDLGEAYHEALPLRPTLGPVPPLMHGRTTPVRPAAEPEWVAFVYEGEDEPSEYRGSKDYVNGIAAGAVGVCDNCTVEVYPAGGHTAVWTDPDGGARHECFVEALKGLDIYCIRYGSSEAEVPRHELTFK